MLRIITLFSFCFLIACGNSVSQNSTNSKLPENTNESLTEIIHQQKDDYFIEMNRSHCFGTCPLYNLRIQSDGKAIFEGIKYTKVIGKVEKILNENQIKTLMSDINKSGFFTFEDFYQEGKNCPEFRTDAPNVVLSINLEDNSKVVRHNHGCQEKGKIFPAELYDLENKIDEIVETKGWIGEGK